MSLNENDYKNLYETISNEAMMGFLCFDLKTRECIYANKLGHDLFELGLDFSVNKLTIDHLFPENPGKKDFRPFNMDMLSHEGLYQSILVQKFNDHKFIATMGVKKIELVNADHILLMVQDTTLQNKLQREVDEKQNAIKNAYEEVLKQNEKLKELDKAKSRFISLTTHELRTPLSAMIATAEVLKYKLYDTPEQLDEFVEIIHSQGMHLMDLINDVLDFSKIQAGHMDYYVEEHDIQKLSMELMTVHQSIADKDNIKISFLNNCENKE